MTKLKSITLLFPIILLVINTAFAQQKQYEIGVDFRIGSSIIEPDFHNNAERLLQIESLMQQLQSDTTINIISVTFSGTASPEGNSKWNHRLAKNRLIALERIIRSHVNIPENLIREDSLYIPWHVLAEKVSASNLKHKDELLKILNKSSNIHFGGITDDERIAQIQALDNGNVWNQLNRLYFSSMRNAYTIIITYDKIPEPVIVDVIPVVEDDFYAEEIKPVPLDLDKIVSTNKYVYPWTPGLYVKTNALGWLASNTNIAVEVDIAKHWSFSIPAYWSSWNYFVGDIKFRVLMVQPEFRYWVKPRKTNDRFFIGAHFGMGYYNIAVKGKYRIQDHDGKSPALGGGLSIGYRMPIFKKDGRFKLEFSVGAGVYKVHYDKFRNIDNGLLTTTKKKTYIGPDNAAVSFVYMFKPWRR